MDADAGFGWRPIDLEQVPAWAGLLAAIDAADADDDHASEQDLIGHLNDPGHDFPRGSVAVYDRDLMIGYGLVASRVTPDGVHAMRHTGGVHPDHRGRGVGTRILAWAQEAADLLHQDLRPGQPLSLTTKCLAGNDQAAALFLAHGFAPSRWFRSMTRDLSTNLPQCLVPDGVRIVGFSAERSPDARLVRNEAFRDHWSSSDTSEEAWAHLTGHHAFRARYSLLAYAGSEPLGLVIGYEYDARTGATTGRDLRIPVVGTRRAGRGRGIATALVARAMSAARCDGFATATLDVDADSPTGAVGLYQRLGFEATGTWIVHTKWLTLLTS